MKNLPIFAKFLSILGVFGVFAILSAFYATSQMRDITTGFMTLSNTSDAAAILIAESSRKMEAIRGDIAMLELSTTLAGNQAADAMIVSDRNNFDQNLTDAAGLLPDRATDILALKAAHDTHPINPAGFGSRHRHASQKNDSWGASNRA